MNHCVPDFETDDDYLFPASSNSKRHKKSAMGHDDIMELLWQNGQVVMQSQNQRSAGGGNKKSETTPSTAGREIRSGVIEDETTPCNLFMQEDEMVSWLHYPSDDNNSLDLYLHNNDILYPVLPSTSIVPVTTVPSSLPPPPPPPLATVPPPPPPPRPPIPPLKRVEEEPSQPKFANFLHFSRPNKGGLTAGGSGPSSSNQMSQAITQSTVVESNIGCRGSMSSFGGAGTSSAGTGREPETCDVSASSSPGTGGSGASASVEPCSHKPPPATDDRKRKGRDTDDTECYSEELEFEYHDPKKKSRGSASSTKRSRAAEVHNLSERRRRDRINEKMKALQELIPRCNKSDKASMLDEAIEYLKSLQMQVQMMSMGYSMVPMMFPGVQRYMPTMAAMGMGMGMGMDHRGMVPYPSVPPMPNSAAQQRFPVPRFQMAQVPIMAHQPRGDNPSDHPMMNSFPPTQNANQPRVPFVDPYQQCLGLPQTQLPQQQNQTGMGGVTSKPSSSKDVRYPHRHPTG